MNNSLESLLENYNSLVNFVALMGFRTQRRNMQNRAAVSRVGNCLGSVVSIFSLVGGATVPIVASTVNLIFALILAAVSRVGGKRGRARRGA